MCYKASQPRKAGNHLQQLQTIDILCEAAIATLSSRTSLVLLLTIYSVRILVCINCARFSYLHRGDHNSWKCLSDLTVTLPCSVYIA